MVLSRSSRQIDFAGGETVPSSTPGRARLGALPTCLRGFWWRTPGGRYFLRGVLLGAPRRGLVNELNGVQKFVVLISFSCSQF